MARTKQKSVSESRNRHATTAGQEKKRRSSCGVSAGQKKHYKNISLANLGGGAHFSSFPFFLSSSPPPLILSPFRWNCKLFPPCLI